MFGLVMSLKPNIVLSKLENESGLSMSLHYLVIYNFLMVSNSQKSYLDLQCMKLYSTPLNFMNPQESEKGELVAFSDHFFLTFRHITWLSTFWVIIICEEDIISV